MRENFILSFLCPRCLNVLKVKYFEFNEHFSYKCKCGCVLHPGKQKALVYNENNRCKWADDCYKIECVMKGGGYYPQIFFSEDDEIFCHDYFDKYCLKIS